MELVELEHCTDMCSIKHMEGLLTESLFVGLEGSQDKWGLRPFATNEEEDKNSLSFPKTLDDCILASMDWQLSCSSINLIGLIDLELWTEAS